MDENENVSEAGSGVASELESKTGEGSGISQSEAGGPIALGIGTVTVQEISRNPLEHRPLHPNTVKFDVVYPKNYPKDKKHMPEGPILVSKEAAEKFTKLGIGKVIE